MTSILSVGLCIPLINFWVPEPVFIKLGILYIMATEPVSTAYIINKSLSSVCMSLCTCLLSLLGHCSVNTFPRQWIHATIEQFWRRSFLCGPCHIKRKWAVISSQNSCFCIKRIGARIQIVISPYSRSLNCEVNISMAKFDRPTVKLSVSSPNDADLLHNDNSVRLRAPERLLLARVRSHA
jgi:hypothetical protein